jgi:molybdate transport system substrate-binding protein
LAITPELTSTGRYTLIPADMHSPLEQGFIVLKRAQNNPLAQKFADFFNDASVRGIINRYGFILPGKRGDGG